MEGGDWKGEERGVEGKNRRKENRMDVGKEGKSRKRACGRRVRDRGRKEIR